MTLLGTGIGEAADGCCFFLVFGGLAAMVAPALVGILRRSVNAVLFSFLLAGLVGAVVVPEAVNHELRDTDDSPGVHAMLWQFVWWWSALLFVPLGAAASLVLRGREPVTDPNLDCPPNEAEIDPTTTEIAPGMAESGTEMRERTWPPDEPVTFRFGIRWLFALCLLLLLASLLAMHTR